MKTWIIEPRDPLIVRDGRPFGADVAGARARSLDFPFPSTTTGGVRTRYGLAKGGNFDATMIAEVKNISVRGPLLVELDAKGHIDQWMLAAPTDALWFEYEAKDDKHAILQRLVPLQLREGEMTNLADGLSPVGLTNPDPQKPFGYAPRYWRWDRFSQWLQNPSTLTKAEKQAVTDFGHNGPLAEERTHVSIAPDTQTAAEGALFQTRGLEFTRTINEQRRRLALAVMTDADLPAGSLSPLGGERRLVTWRNNQDTQTDCFSDFLPKLRSAIQDTAACRVVLLTPAHFKAGYCPEWLLQPRYDVTCELKAAAVHRAQVVSGWDFEKKGPKPTRRLAPAGSVYFLKLTGTTEAIGNWVDAMWMNCISDEEQDRKDGFGLIALGAWSGQCEEMEVKQ